MLFNSYAFMFGFFPLVFVGFFLLARYRQVWATLWLGLASVAFYAWWSIGALPLLLASICVNYLFSRRLAPGSAADTVRRRLLILAVALNLIALGVFKYADFFIGSVNVLTGLRGAPPLPLLHLVLPIGISFFTFTQIAFLVDCYQGKVRETKFMHYLLFVTYFPHLIAGPVLHHAQMMPQFREQSTYRIDYDNISRGIVLFTIGLAKKIIFADSFALYADAAFSAAAAGHVLSIYEAWAAGIAYAFQIYFDFSGYTDMALGVSAMFNIRLPINFNSPYKATSIIDFWRRWHITLSTFLRDYLYIPLGGNRKGKTARYINLMITMLLGGLWHGAAWTFVAWGALHGAYLCLNHWWNAICPGGLAAFLPKRLAALLGGALTFLVVVVAWVAFRANDFGTCLRIWQAMFGLHAMPIGFDSVLHGGLFAVSKSSGRDFLIVLLPAMLWIWGLPSSAGARVLPGRTAWAVLQAAAIVAVLAICIDSFGTYSPFLYFQF